MKPHPFKPCQYDPKEGPPCPPTEQWKGCHYSEPVTYPNGAVRKHVICTLSAPEHTKGSR